MRSIICANLLLAGCATTGTKVEADQAAQFKPGISTYSDVVAKFGRPQSETLTSNGAKSVVYFYMHTAVRAETFIPVVGAFVGGADSTNNMVIFRFGPDGRLIDTTSSSGQTGTGHNLAGG